jgi:hypothetical protein
MLEEGEDGDGDGAGTGGLRRAQPRLRVSDETGETQRSANL